jgi:hypothetical protein
MVLRIVSSPASQGKVFVSMVGAFSFAAVPARRPSLLSSTTDPTQNRGRYMRQGINELLNAISRFSKRIESAGIHELANSRHLHLQY